MLRLYVSGHVDTGGRAASHVRRICEEVFGDAVDMLDVIDVRAHPELAEQDKILATPTLVRKAPPPPRRVIGDFSDTERVLSALGIECPAGLGRQEGSA
jgi:circadian clock protein KaiB